MAVISKMISMANGHLTKSVSGPRFFPLLSPSSFNTPERLSISFCSFAGGDDSNVITGCPTPRLDSGDNAAASICPSFIGDDNVKSMMFFPVDDDIVKDRSRTVKLVMTNCADVA